MYQLKTLALASIVILALTISVQAGSCCAGPKCQMAGDSSRGDDVARIDDSGGPMHKVLGAYFGIRAELAKDSTKNIPKFAKAIQAHVEELKKGDLGLSPDDSKEFLRIADDISRSAGRLKGRKIKDDRENFKSLSESLIEYLKEFQSKSDGPDKLYVFYCPMADAAWVQGTKNIGNPYMGSRMLKCGKLLKDKD